MAGPLYSPLLFFTLQLLSAASQSVWFVSCLCQSVSHSHRGRSSLIALPSSHPRRVFFALFFVSQLLIAEEVGGRAPRPASIPHGSLPPHHQLTTHPRPNHRAQDGTERSLAAEAKERAVRAGYFDRLCAALKAHTTSDVQVSSRLGSVSSLPLSRALSRLAPGLCTVHGALGLCAGRERRRLRRHRGSPRRGGPRRRPRGSARGDAARAAPLGGAALWHHGAQRHMRDGQRRGRASGRARGRPLLDPRGDAPLRTRALRSGRVPAPDAGPRRRRDRVRRARVDPAVGLHGPRLPRGGRRREPHPGAQ